MKLPIWAKDRVGKYRVFPYELLEMFGDGSMGVLWPNHYHMRQGKMLEQFGDHFEKRRVSVQTFGKNAMVNRTVYILKSTIKGAK